MSVDGVADVLSRAITDNTFEASIRDDPTGALSSASLTTEELRFFTQPKKLTADEVDQVNATGFSLATYGSAFGYVNRNISSLSAPVRKKLNEALSHQDFNLLRAVPCTGWD